MKQVRLKNRGQNVHRMVENLISFFILSITSGKSHYRLDMFGLRNILSGFIWIYLVIYQKDPKRQS